MPASKKWATVSRRYRTPGAAVWLAAGLALALPLLILGLAALRPKDIDFTKLYPAVVGISTIGLYLSYGLPLVLKMIAVRRGVWRPSANGPWSLGRWSVPVNCIAIVWIAFITVLFVVPPNALTGYIFGGTLAALLLFYAVAVRGKFKGPVGQAQNVEGLQKLEAEFEGDV